MVRGTQPGGPRGHQLPGSYLLDSCLAAPAGHSRMPAPGAWRRRLPRRLRAAFCLAPWVSWQVCLADLLLAWCGLGPGMLAWLLLAWCGLGQ